MTVTPVFARNSATSRQRAKSNPELTVPSLQTAEAAPLKTVSTPVKLDNNEIGEDIHRQAGVKNVRLTENIFRPLLEVRSKK